MKILLLLMIMINLSGCGYIYEKKIEIDHKKMCRKEIYDGQYPFNVRPIVVMGDNHDFSIKLLNSTRYSAVIGKYAYQPKLELISSNENKLEWCPYPLFDMRGSSIIVSKKGSKSATIPFGILNKGVEENSLKDGVYKTRFRVAEAATDWCDLTIENGDVSSLECPVDSK